jgi:nucleoside-diphosphate-sugar epimerase
LSEPGLHRDAVPGVGGEPMSCGRHALVTGATGFTGGHLCRHLRAAGYEVTALVRAGRDTSRLEAMGIRLAAGDVRDPRSLPAAMAGVDVVYHIAAAFRDASLPDRTFFEVNVGGTRNMVQAAAEAGVSRFVYCSTVGVHGDTGREPVTEEGAFKAPDIYCQSKIEGELAARELFDRLELAGTVFRPMGIYGPGDQRFLKLFRSVRRRRFVMIGSGETYYHMTHVDDLCRGILLCGEHPAAVGQAFLLAGERYTTLNELVACIADACGVKPLPLHVPLTPVLWAAHACDTICRPLGISPPLYPRRVHFFCKDRAADISKARELLGYAPRIGLEEGIRTTAEWYRAHRWM